MAEWTEAGHIGDVNWPAYGGGPVLCRVPERGEQLDIYGDCRLEYVEPPEDDVDFDDPRARWTIYRVDLDPEVPSWGELEDVARSAGQDPDELAAAFESTNPVERAWAYETWAGHYGWRNFDDYPLVLDRDEIEARYDLEL